MNGIIVFVKFSRLRRRKARNVEQLQFTPYSKWSKEAEAYLMENWEAMPTRIIAHVLEKTVESVRAKAWRMGLRRKA